MSPATLNLLKVLARAVARTAYQIGYEQTASDVEDALFEFEEEQGL